nr:apolipoprotein N-acyltransferase [Saccharopolyspora sp. HNM0983]
MRQLLVPAAVATAGFALYAASPPRPAWWVAPLAFAVLAAAVRGRRMRTGFGLGTLFGLAFLLPLLGWLQDFLGADFGPWPWLGVAAVQALFVGAAGAGMALVGRLRAAPAWTAVVFVAVESLRSAVPFGGFPWGRLAFTQANGLFLPLASLGGAVAVGLAVALTGSGLAELGWRLREGSRSPRAWAGPLVAVLAPVALGAAVLPSLDNAPGPEGTARVAAVQGNAPNLGLGLLSEDAVLRENHLRGAERLAEDVQAGAVPRPDLVVLPEQVGSWGPDRSDPGLSRVAERLGVPLAVGGLSLDPDGQLRNRVFEWQADTGAGQQYTKQHLVPFAETIPMRPVARLVSPFVDRFQQDMVAADEPGVLDIGPVRLGIGICYDVAYDDVFTGAVREGATLLTVPTNNAWYGHSEMSHQQLAMSQLRAVEHGRAVVVSATSGVSAVVQPDGTVVQSTDLFTEQNLIADVPLRSSTTPATWLGGVPMWAVALAAAGAVVVAARRGRG